MKKRIAAALLIIALLAGGVWWGIYRSYHNPVVTHYALGEPGKDTVRVVLIADLHDMVFVEGNEEVCALVKEQEPDLILLAGDLLNDDSESTDIALGFIRRMMDIAPVYVSLGNQEKDYMYRNGIGLLEEYQQTGAVLLELEYTDIEIKGRDFRIGGMYEYAFRSGKEDYEAITRFLNEYQDTDRYTIMMAHRPDSFVFLSSNPWDIDLVVSGHLHGGQVILPQVGGLWAPDQGWFPEYDYGQYDLNGTTVIITTGLGTNKEKLPRFNNPPEIVTIDIGTE